MCAVTLRQHCVCCYQGFSPLSRLETSLPSLPSFSRFFLIWRCPGLWNLESAETPASDNTCLFPRGWTEETAYLECRWQLSRGWGETMAQEKVSRALAFISLCFLMESVTTPTPAALPSYPWANRSPSCLKLFLARHSISTIRETIKILSVFTFPVTRSALFLCSLNCNCFMSWESGFPETKETDTYYLRGGK